MLRQLMIPASLLASMVVIAGFLYPHGSSVASVERAPSSDFVRLKMSDGSVLDVGRHEITVGEWNACVADGACPPAKVSARAAPDHPVTRINWFDTQSYIAWYRGNTGHVVRLPSRDEWLEFAGNHAPKPRKKLFDDPRLSWAADYDLSATPKSRVTRRVGSFEINEVGLADLKGNVWEWTGSECGAGTLQDAACRSGRIAMGEHEAVLSDFVKDPGNASCGAGLPPTNLGFRLVSPVT